ncbi:tRNA (guanine(37)-N(1))-methyltransferase [Candidatus Saccharibacteria bacterium]|nr:tRNA (guanine(37)-N(1))-methyltransferase [Candidatus Saccharibacteria bacterium]
MIKFTIITLFREAIEPYLKSSMMEKASRSGLAEFDFVNLRDFGLGPHKSVDDTPYGGGDGMLLRCEPVYAAIESVKAKDPSAKVILPTPVGETWTQEMAWAFMSQPEAFRDEQVKPSSRSIFSDGENTERPSPVTTGARERSEKNGFACSSHFIILCPHYEGYDERILDLVDYKISLGKYILTGGELPALIIIDSIVRLIPGVLGGENSAKIESFSHGDNLEYPQYTRPEDFRGKKVPEVLLSGNHAAIAKWREEHSK